MHCELFVESLRLLLVVFLLTFDTILCFYARPVRVCCFCVSCDVTYYALLAHRKYWTWDLAIEAVPDLANDQPPGQSPLQRAFTLDAPVPLISRDSKYLDLSRACALQVSCSIASPALVPDLAGLHSIAAKLLQVPQVSPGTSNYSVARQLQVTGCWHTLLLGSLTYRHTTYKTA